jgi:hypothetical protein
MPEEMQAEKKEDLKALMDMSFDDLCKLQYRECMRIGSYNPELLPNAVGILERMLWDELDSDYQEKVNAVIVEAEKLFPQWRTDKEQRLQWQVFVALGRFALLTQHIKTKIPKEVILEL